MQQWTRAKTLVTIMLTSVLCQCSLLVPPMPDDPHYAPSMPEPPPAQPVSLGSLYTEGYETSLYSDRVAHRVGDTLTIVLREKTDATKAASTNSTKSSNTDISNPTFLGSAVDFSAPRWLPLQSHRNNNFNINMQGERDFSGSGDSKQNNSLSGTITVTVAHVYPNGNLFVKGEKWLNINQGDEFIRLSGILRPDDVQPDNTADSTRLADARISYSGRGQISESNSMGWLQRFFNGASKLWLY